MLFSANEQNLCVAYRIVVYPAHKQQRLKLSSIEKSYFVSEKGSPNYGP